MTIWIFVGVLIVAGLGLLAWKKGPVATWTAVTAFVLAVAAAVADFSGFVIGG